MKICIIKLGALGDVVRTLSILPAIKEKYPESEIIWITKSNAYEIVKNSAYVKEVYTLPFSTLEKFDILYNFDVEEDATNLAMKIEAEKKYGFYSNSGYPSAFNFHAEYYLNTLFDDELKKSNKKTYQEMMFEAAELEYKKQHHEIYLSEENKKYAQEFVEKNHLNTEKLIGIHLGASSRWPSKKWDIKNLNEFIEKANKEEHEIILFGGPNEKDEHDNLFKELNEKGIKVNRNNPENSILEFASLVNLCKVMICADSLALHISLALKKPTIGLFFVTSHSEVEEYGLLKKIISPMLDDFFPERMDEYSKKVTKSISANEVLEEVEKILGTAKCTHKLQNARAKKVVNAIIKNSSNKILMIKRKDEKIHGGKWAFPGGIVEGGESIEEALRRELKEEVGLEMIKIFKKISDYSYPRGNEIQTKGECFLVEVKNLNVTINKEIEKFRWVTLEELEGLDHISGLEEEAMEALFGDNF